MVSCCLTSSHKPGGWRRTWSLVAFGGLGVLLCGCTAFNPAFVNLLEPGGSTSFATLPNAPGHVVIAIVNNTEVDEQLATYLGRQLNLSVLEISKLRPRVRIRVLITYVDGTSQTVEFIDGSPKLVDPAFNAQAFPDLNQNDLNNVVVLCDVASVQILPGGIEVFIPVPLAVYSLVQVQAPGGEPFVQYLATATLPPIFRKLQVDEVDGDGNVIAQRNIGVRDSPGPIPNVLCGSVVGITIDGVLAVPFFSQESDAPSYFIQDITSLSRIGGRYEVTVRVR
jgi:hypothetical protein